MTTSCLSCPTAASCSRRSDPDAAGINLRADPHRTTGLGVCVRSRSDPAWTSISPTSRSPARETSQQFLAAPVFGKNTLLGVVILRLNGGEIFRIVSDRTGLGETGETLLNRRIGDDAVIMVPVRGGFDPPFTRRVALGSPFGIPDATRSAGLSRAKAWSSIIGTGASWPSGATCRHSPPGSW